MSKHYSIILKSVKTKTIKLQLQNAIVVWKIDYALNALSEHAILYWCPEINAFSLKPCLCWYAYWNNAFDAFSISCSKVDNKIIVKSANPKLRTVFALNECFGTIDCYNSFGFYHNLLKRHCTEEDYATIHLMTNAKELRQLLVKLLSTSENAYKTTSDANIQYIG